MSYDSELTRTKLSQSDHRYFDSYNDVEVHQLMLNDQPRMEAYKNAILENEHLFKDKIVMDIGAGTGILSLLMAKVGAKKVYSIEASSLALTIPDIAKDNGFEERIEVFHIPVEEFTLPSEQKVDVIVSEWMGFYLLHESMLSSVIKARDKFLSEEGVIFPSEASLYASPCSMERYYKDHFYFWQNICGFDLSRMRDIAYRSKQEKPEVCEVKSEDLLSEPVCIKTFNLRYISNQDIERFSCTNFVGITKTDLYQGLAIWFTCEFDGRDYNEIGEEFGKLIQLSTSPFQPLTHWKQTVIILGPMKSLKNTTSPIVQQSSSQAEDSEITQTEDSLNPANEYLVEKDEVVGWKIDFEQSKENPRHYNITLEMLDPEDNEHPVPCSCPMPRCLIIAKMIENEET